MLAVYEQSLGEQSMQQPWFQQRAIHGFTFNWLPWVYLELLGWLPTCSMLLPTMLSQHPLETCAIEHPAFKYLQYYIFVPHPGFCVFVMPIPAATFYWPAASPVTKHGIAYFATPSAYCAHVGVTPPTHWSCLGPTIIILRFLGPDAQSEQLLSRTL